MPIAMPITSTRAGNIHNILGASPGFCRARRPGTPRMN